jgi:hypothetical protein
VPDPIAPRLTRRLPAAIPPRWGFLKGLCVGAVVEVPAFAASVWLLGRLGASDPDAGFTRLFRLTAVFAGIAAVLTAAGIGRIAAQASVAQVSRGDEVAIGGRRHAMWIAARTHAVAGIGLLIIAAIPQGHLPDHHARWLIMVPVGTLAGAVCGLAIGVVCGGSAPINIFDVLALARTPTAKLRNLLDPEDLVKIAAIVRARTTRVFHNMFDPAAPPPSEPKHDEKRGDD